MLAPLHSKPILSSLREAVIESLNEDFLVCPPLLLGFIRQFLSSS
jgi:hypothetical protein